MFALVYVDFHPGTLFKVIYTSIMIRNILLQELFRKIRLVCYSIKDVEKLIYHQFKSFFFLVVQLVTAKKRESTCKPKTFISVHVIAP